MITMVPTRLLGLAITGAAVLPLSTVADEPFLNAPRVIATPGAEYRGAARRFQGIPSLARSPKGRLWATWYGGKGGGEDQHNYVMVVTSGDNGATWSDEVLVVDPDGDGPVRAFDPEIWCDPTGKLWLFWAQAIGHEATRGGVWTVTTSEPDRADAGWSTPRRLTDGVMMCKPTVLSTGEWLLPASTWRKTDNSARCVVSQDEGATWSVQGACHVQPEHRAFDEHMVVERRDGTLWMLLRTKYGIGESVSADRGKTWGELTPSTIRHPSARFFIRTLRSGNLLLVKHGPIAERTGRSHLTAFLSTDDGATWSEGLLLDERKGVSYPDGVQAEDGTIYIIYDYSRTAEKEILMACFTEADVAAGRAVSGKMRLRVLVNKASGPDPATVMEDIARAPNDDGQALLTGDRPDIDVGNAKVDDVKRGAVLFTDRGYRWSEVPAALQDRKFVVMGIDGGRVTCTRAGVLYVATPLRNRNRDSLTEALTKQGFAKAKLPEFLMFDHQTGAANLCSLFQKQVSRGDIVTLGKWGVVVY